MKKLFVSIIALISSLLLMIGGLSSCNFVEVEKIKPEKTELTLSIGDEEYVSCTVLPEEGESLLSWESSNENVAKVSKHGIITAVGAGKCTITVSAGDKTAMIKVTVKPAIEQILFFTSNVTIKEEENYTVSFSIRPSNADSKTIEWSSSNPAVATVDQNGKITGVKEGSCSISASAGDTNSIISVQVKKKGPDFAKIYEEIESDVKYGWTLASDGSYLRADTNVYNLDDYSNYAIWQSILDVNEKLGLPESLKSDMETTSALMGRQHQTFSNIGLEVSWTYHPDKGIEVTYKLLEN